MSMKTIFLLFLVLGSVLAAKQYAGYQVLRVIPRDTEQLAALYGLFNRIKDSVDFWKEPRSVNRPVDIMIGPEHLVDVKNELSGLGLNFTVFIDNVQEGIEQERCGNCAAPTAGFDYTKYHTVEEIVQWITDFTEEQPLATAVNVGMTYEGREIRAVKISTGESGKRAVYIQGGIHAREWIAPATVIYMTNLLATTYDTNPDVKKMVDNYDWYIVPSLNMDGYKYTWTDDRYWRKNRQPTYEASCIGTDLNRNYPYEWGGKGASSFPCAETFRGEGALSAVETSTVHRWLKQMSGNLALFIDFHNYGQLWLYPWGYTGDRKVPQPDKEVQDELARLATDALKVPYGTEYFVGMSGPDMYPASGASEDYGYGILGVKYSYVVELRDKGRYGFLIPDSMIEESAVETFEALKVLGTNPLN